MTRGTHRATIGRLRTVIFTATIRGDWRAIAEELRHVAAVIEDGYQSGEGWELSDNEPHRVYFDADAEAIDGKGWTVDDGGSIVVRYATQAEANLAAAGPYYS